MCDIHSATVSSCELPVCMLCDAVSCSHHCCRAAVIAVFIPTRASSAPKTPFQVHVHTRTNVCVPVGVCIVPLRVSGAWKGSWVYTL